LLRYFCIELKDTPMVDANIKITNDLQQFPLNVWDNEEVILQYINSIRDLARNRDIPFSVSVSLPLNMVERSLSIEQPHRGKQIGLLSAAGKIESPLFRRLE
jgi:hypothetical protein